MRGTVKWFDIKRGFGFIKQDNDEDIFVHYNQIEKEGFKTLKEGELVEFDVIKTENGLRAEKVKPIIDLQTIK